MASSGVGARWKLGSKLKSEALERLWLRVRFWYDWIRKEALDISESIDAVALKIALGFAFGRVERRSIWDMAFIDEGHVWGVLIQTSLFFGRLWYGPWLVARSPIYDIELGAIGGLCGRGLSIERYKRAHGLERWERTRYDMSPLEADDLKQEVNGQLMAKIREHGAGLRGLRRWVAYSAARKLERAGGV